MNSKKASVELPRIIMLSPAYSPQRCMGSDHVLSWAVDAVHGCVERCFRIAGHLPPTWSRLKTLHIA